VTEDELLIGVTDLMTAGKWRWVHFRRSDKAKMMGHAGLPDIIAVSASRRRLLFIELKGSRGRTAPEQHEWLADLLRVSGQVVEPSAGMILTAYRMPEVYVWKPSDWHDGTIEERLL